LNLLLRDGLALLLGVEDNLMPDPTRNRTGLKLGAINLLLTLPTFVLINGFTEKISFFLLLASYPLNETRFLLKKGFVVIEGVNTELFLEAWV
jgi:hypothetical protein